MLSILTSFYSKLPEKLIKSPYRINVDYKIELNKTTLLIINGDFACYDRLLLTACKK